ncbi:hypothetical protein SAMN05216198_0113 [Halopseudomonas litoralis]|uniref:Uncharacterized protein n=1 Tax=Halopseudomonas litoralis TaxID=797277 RepID=A0A1H1L6N6_9GAMM|nr:hypothetical protein SAMN05216198_0113 [Halopseudomonas litoralis]
MSVKGRRAERTLDAQSTALRFHQRQAVVSGWGMNPCPEPETRAVLNLVLSEQSSQRPGIVTRQGGDSNKVNDSVSVANRARKGPQQVQQLILDFEEHLSADLPFCYRGLRYVLDILARTHLDRDITDKVSDPAWLETFHRNVAGYLSECGGMAGQW